MFSDGDDSSLPNPRHLTPKLRGTLNLPLPTRSPYAFRSRPSQSSPDPPNALDTPQAEDISFISHEDWGRLQLEVASLQSEICSLRLQHDEELKAIRAELKTMSAKPTPQPVIPPAEQPAEQPVPQPDSQPVPQYDFQPVTQPNPPLTILCPAPGKKRKKKKKKKDRNINPSCKPEIYNFNIKSLAPALIRLSDEELSRACFGYVPHITPCFQFFHTLSTSPISNFSSPRRARIAPGIRPGIIPLMDIVFS